MSELSKEHNSKLRELREELVCWQDYYDPADDKEQHEMFVLAADAVAELLALRGRAELVYYGPYTPVMMGAGVWVSIADELPPHLEGREVWVTTAPPAPVVPAPAFNSACGFEDFWSNFEHPFAEDDELKSFASEIYRAAMLKGAENAESRCGNSPVVPDEMPETESEDGNDIDYMEPSAIYELGKTHGWNAYRAAMLQGVEPVSTAYKLPDGWVVVPEEPTEEMLCASYRAASVYSATAYRAMIAAAPAPGKEE